MLLLEIMQGSLERQTYNTPFHLFRPMIKFSEMLIIYIKIIEVLLSDAVSGTGLIKS